jgi:hypothetical protein
MSLFCVSLYVSISVRLSSVHPSACLSVGMCVCLSVCMTVNRLSVRQSLPVNLCECMFACLILCLSVSVCLSVYLSALLLLSVSSVCLTGCGKSKIEGHEEDYCCIYALGEGGGGCGGGRPQVYFQVGRSTLRAAREGNCRTVKYTIVLSHKSHVSQLT